MFAVAGVVGDAGAVWAGGVTLRLECEDALYTVPTSCGWRIEIFLLLSGLPPSGGRGPWLLV